ncbi:MAG: hypothetical protein A2156_05835 [Deltaproteobacteria bacterium RBG_16_48_10]|nr:MAG: hypothetical protein A2156_05835 [Deltaproteobacteria bacterium RBG_16_48_10]
MPICAYIFIECAMGTAKDVAKEASRIMGVKQASVATGPYDVVVLVETPDVSNLGNFIVTKIQGLSGVLKTQTNIIVD